MRNLTTPVPAAGLEDPANRELQPRIADSAIVIDTLASVVYKRKQ